MVGITLNKLKHYKKGQWGLFLTVAKSLDCVFTKQEEIQAFAVVNPVMFLVLW